VTLWVVRCRHATPLAHLIFVYDSLDNDDPDEDSDGTEIAILQS
jgi:hypothetical protein